MNKLHFVNWMFFGVFLGIILINNQLFAQGGVLNTSLYFPEKNIAYRNYSNQLTLDNVAINSSTYILVGENKLDRFDSLFIYNPMTSNNKETLMIYTNGNKVGEVEMQIETLNPPKIYFGDARNQNVKLESILENPGLHLSYEPQFLIPNFYVSSCEMFITKGGKKEISVMIFGNAFSGKQVKMLSKLKAGDSLRFGQATLTDFMGNDGVLNADFSITIIE